MAVRGGQDRGEPPSDPAACRQRRRAEVASDRAGGREDRRGGRVHRSRFVFASPLGAPLREDVVYTRLRRTIADLNAKTRTRAEAEGAKPTLMPTVTLYALRHTAATLMLEAGIAMKVVQGRLRHSTMMLTADTYSHVSASLQARAVEDFTRYMAAADEGRGA